MKKIDLNKVLESVLKVYAGLQVEKALNSNNLILEANREIGRILANAEKKVTEEERKSGRWMRTISEELKGKLNKGFSERSLFYAQKFYKCYGDVKLSSKLSWSHYRLLSSIENIELREKIEKDAIENAWSRDVLCERIREVSESRKSPTIQWRRPEGVLHHFKIVKKNETLLLDLGFYFYQELSNTSKYKEGDILKLKQKGKITSYERVESITPSYLYCYPGIVERVIDGDTLLLQIDLGLKLITRQRVRLHNVWASELDTEDGKKQFRSLEKRLPSGSVIVVKTRSKDIYGRYVGDVLYLPKRDSDPETVLREGKYLNQELGQLIEAE
ncbi:DUF1016 family protein [Leptospira langatensis]|uniref:DUF1016 family protein n=1 Tax=Leptospira langatensis TaxID=2484983 RepID=A0A5F1ZPH8_9LEPT|nr:DUF1016 N-terminal domain-containing protein [Leptospira langatensis]TGK05471.1 DUF1016 family protein [Leptospira langatensis]TGL38607.1 DUF1016 family protein [Leptospira langatensis]